MDDICMYQIKIRGQIDAGDIRAFGPPDLQVKCHQDVTYLTFQTDQSGLIGFLRHLHGCNFFLLSILACINETDSITMNRSLL
jgi:hypothetical protein